MRSIFPLFFLALVFNFLPSAFAQNVSYPTPSGYVVDQSGIIDAGTQAKLNAWILELKQKTTAEVAVVTVDSTEPLSIEEYAANLFQRFGIGKKGKDNGVLLLIATKDHATRIEVGYGLEGAITDAQSSLIINEIIVPAFKQGDFSQGVEKGAAAIVSLIAKEYNVSLTGVRQPEYQDQQAGGSGWLFLLILCILISFFISRGGGGGMFMPMILPGGGYGRGGYGGGGGFSGGFGGFGGGSSGGGGASGRW